MEDKWISSSFHQNIS